jgi:hypothetical protein
VTLDRVETTPGHHGWWLRSKGGPDAQTAVGPVPARPEGCCPPVTEDVVSRAMALALVVAEFTVVGAGQAFTRQMGCGDTITTDMTLDSDLVNCPNNGIVIGADNITLDLNGYTIAADGHVGRFLPPRVRTVTSACSTGPAMTG